MHNHNDSRVNILFAHYGQNWIRGSERCLLDLLRHLDRKRYRPIVWCNSQILSAQLKLIDVEVIHEDFDILFGWQAPRFNIVKYFQLIVSGIKIVRRYHIHLIHANSGAPNQWLAPIARCMQRPLIAHLHAPYIFRDRLTLNLHQATKIIGVSSAVAEPFLEDGIQKDKVGVIYNGIDTDALEKAPAVKLDTNIKQAELTLVTVGSLIKRKGIDLTLHALREVIDEGVSARLLIIGDGGERNALEDLKSQLGLDEYVSFLGERSDVQSLLTGNADILISSARDEAFGLALAEAGLAGLPVVATSVGGIPEVVTHGQTGLLVAPQNVAELAKAIKYLYRNPREIRRLGNNARVKVRKFFSIKSNVKAFESLYQEVLFDAKSKEKNQGTWLVTPLIKKAIIKYLRRHRLNVKNGAEL